MILRRLSTPTPLGNAVVVLRDDAVCALGFGRAGLRLRHGLERRFGAFQLEPGRDRAGVGAALADYFGGDLAATERVEVDPGGTPFQRRVWTLLRKVPAGRRVSYGTLAHTLGKPGAARAVGTANAANPVALLIPCHRVVASDGRACGYAWGTGRKRWLLAHESAGSEPRA